MNWKKIAAIGCAGLLSVSLTAGCSAASMSLNQTVASSYSSSAATAYMADIEQGEVDKAANKLAAAAATPMNPSVGAGSAYDPAAVVEETASEPNPSTSGGPGSDQDIPTGERKIIRNASLHMETKEFDSSVETVTSIAEEFGGYIQSSDVSGTSLYRRNGYSSREASLVLRIPSDQLDACIQNLSENFNMVSRSISEQDVSDHYYDSQARLRSLQIQEERLLEMMQQATVLADLLEIERELSNVRYQIESYQTTLNRLDKQISYSTVDLHLTEVVEYQENRAEPKSFGERISQTIKDSGENFIRSSQNLVLAAIYAAPMLLLAAIALIVLILIIRVLLRRRRAKAANKAEKEKK